MNDLVKNELSVPQEKSTSFVIGSIDNPKTVNVSN